MAESGNLTARVASGGYVQLKLDWTTDNPPAMFDIKARRFGQQKWQAVAFTTLRDYLWVPPQTGMEWEVQVTAIDRHKRRLGTEIALVRP